MVRLGGMKSDQNRSPLAYTRSRKEELRWQRRCQEWTDYRENNEGKSGSLTERMSEGVTQLNISSPPESELFLKAQ